MSYFDSVAGVPVSVEDAGSAVKIARKSITERDRRYALETLHARVAAGAMTIDKMADLTAAVQVARNRGELAAALKIEVADLKVAPPRIGGLWLLVIALVVIAGATRVAESGRSFLVILLGFLLMATAVYRLNSAEDRASRFLIAVLTALVTIGIADLLSAVVGVVSRH